MKKTKLLLATLLAVGAASTAALGASLTASAARSTISGSSVFYASGATITSTEVGADKYTSFSFTANSHAITYRKNLAYRWLQADEAESTTAESHAFSMSFGFKALNFERFTIKFQSQQFEKTKDGVTTNWLVFLTKTEGDQKSLYAYATDDKDAAEYTYERAETMNQAMVLVENYEKIDLAFVDYEDGEYALSLNGETGVELMFRNVGNTYAKYYSSSSSTATMPLTFNALLSNASETVNMTMYSLNEQSFKLTSSGYITDDVAPVLCLNDEINFVKYGSKLSFDYTAIDVVSSSVTSTLYFYTLTKDAVDNNVQNFKYNDESYVKVASDSTVRVIEYENSYDVTDDLALQSANVQENVAALNDLGLLVKVCVKAVDATANGETSYNYLDWFVDEDWLANVNDNNFLFVGTDGEGASYDDESFTGKHYDQNVVDVYQEQVDSLTRNDRDESTLIASSTDYFYLPSVKDLMKDRTNDYKDLTYSIYYYTSNSTSIKSETSLAYNQLAIKIASVGDYRFTVYATDASSNAMYYFDRETGEKVEFKGTDIAELDEGIVPWFTFKVSYGGAKAEAPESQAIAYVGTTFFIEKFTITGVSDQYNTKYSLWKFDVSAYQKDHGIMTYGLFSTKVKEENMIHNPETRKYFEKIPTRSSMMETDAEYAKYYPYAWNESAMSFVPQSDKEYYVVELELSDKNLLTDSVHYYSPITASVKTAAIKGEDDFWKNNAVSFILLGIASLCFIGIIVLFIVKPKDEDVDVRVNPVKKD